MAPAPENRPDPATRPEVAAPPCIVLPAMAGDGGAPPVRIFLGTEPAQYRAERVFVWSIERVRSRARRYEIYLMRDLAGFDRRGWTTGFTNHRFAIPHYAGGTGRAIYNDVDQIYLADPAQLFDAPFDGHAILAVAADDLSVALIDCARMADVWTLAAAQRESKKALLAHTASIPGLVGHFDAGWNTRDADEYAPGRARCYHFTTLHTQPWRPFPERFVYQNHPHAGLWHDLEASANEAGFEVFRRDHPSRAFGDRQGPACAPLPAHFDTAIADLCRATGARRVVEGVDGETDRDAGSAAQRWEAAIASREGLAELASSADGRAWDGVVCGDALARTPADDLPWVLDALFARASCFVFAALACRASTVGPRDLPPIGTPQTREWWSEHLRRAAERHPNVHWELATWEPDGAPEYARGGPFLGAGPPRVWVLRDDRPGNSTQSIGLAEELGWPYETIDLTFTPLARLHNELLGASTAGIARGSKRRLAAPWPDLVIAAGRRTAPVARWIRERSEGRTRIVQLGRKGANPAEHFDLCVTPSYVRLLPHPRRMETAAPLTRVRLDALGEAAQEWIPRFRQAPEPRIAVLVGGGSKRHVLSADEARKMGEAIARMSKETGGSVFVTTSRRTPAEAVDALEASLPDAACFHRWTADPAVPNPYLGYLALADAFVVTDESESMVAEACATGKPVSLYPVPVRPMSPLLRLGEHIVRGAYGKPLNHRGTTRPQRGFEKWCSILLARGYVRPPRDLRLMSEGLEARGLANAFDGAIPPVVAGPSRELRNVADRVRRLMGRDVPKALGSRD